MALLGLDLSITSPGIVVCDEKNCIMIAYFYPLRKRDIGFNKILPFKYKNIPWQFQIVALLEDNLKAKSMMERYDIILFDILKIIDRYHIKEVFIEGYSYNSVSSSVSKLYEIGGIVRYTLWKRKISYHEFAPTSIKKIFTGSGCADKRQMYQTFVSKRNFPDLLLIFNLEKCKDIAHPVQDIVDAVALICCKIEKIKNI